MKPDDGLVSRLLAGEDRLSRVEKDAVLDRVLPAPAHKTRWLWLAVPALAAIALVLIAPWRSKDEFTPRGGSASAGVLHVACAGGCTRGAKLVFDLHGSTYRYFAAFTKRSDGTVLWYFPTSDRDSSIAIPEGGILDRGVVLGDDHPAGTYRVYGVFSAEPLTRAAIRDAFDGGKLAIVTADVEVR